MKIFLMGLTSSGKSFQAKKLASFFDLEYISGSVVLLEKLGFRDTTTHHLWFDEKGTSIEHERNDSDVDKEVDFFLLNEAETKQNVIFDSWTLPYLYKDDDALMIYLNPPLASRARMAYESKQDKSLHPREIEYHIDRKDRGSRERFLSLYGFDIFHQTHFHIIIDNSLLRPQQTSLLLVQYISQAMDGKFNLR